MEDSTLDFDQFWADHTDSSPTVRIKFFGRWAELNTDISLIEMQQMASVKTEDIGELQRMAVRLFGQEVFDYWVESGLKFAQLSLLIMWALLRIQGIELTFGQVSEQMSRMVGKALTSSESTGEQSKPTSNNTTASVRTPLGPLVRADSTFS